jgi:hypothetical protein
MEQSPSWEANRMYENGWEWIWSPFLDLDPRPSEYEAKLKQMRSANFWAITKRVVVIPYRRVETTYRSRL